LWEQFRDGLEVCGYFGGMSEGSPEHAARMKAAETTFENSLKKFRCSTTEQKDAQIVAEAFKVQGNYCVLFVLRHTNDTWNVSLQLKSKTS
jgi:hypothetical protein